MTKKFELDLHKLFKPLIDPSHAEYNKRYKVFYGGRGSGKSHGVGECLLARAMQRKELILCAREFQNSISDSVMALFQQKIDLYGLNQYFRITNTELECTLTGSMFIFKGLRNNIQSIKSTEGVTICWVEEAQRTSRESLDVLIPTIRAEGSQIIFTFNPDQETDPVYNDFVKNTHPDAYVAQINYLQNKHLPNTLKKEAEYMRGLDPNAYAHIWLGECRTNTDAQVFAGAYEIKEFETPHNAEFMFGADWGFSQDPTTLIRCYVDNGELYIDHEIYKVGLEIRDTAEAFKSMPEASKHVIRADNARPETISHVRADGLNVQPVAKWGGSVEDGIAFIKSFKRIYIHPRCKNTIDEFRFYSYKINKLTNEPTTIILDEHNHCIDALRYALQVLIKRGGIGGFITI